MRSDLVKFSLFFDREMVEARSISGMYLNSAAVSSHCVVLDRLGDLVARQ